MKALMRFWRQPCKRYRNFQIMFTILTLNFAIPTLSYVFAPEVAFEQFVQINATLGGEVYTYDEAGSRLWRYLGAANVATLALMCFLLQVDLRAWRMVLFPLTFMKSLAATLWLAGWLNAPEYPVLLAAAILDYVTSAAFVWFALRALFEIDAYGGDDDLVPRPVSGGETWTSLERRWGAAILRAVIPGDAHERVPGFDALDAEGVWARFAHRAPAHLMWGLRASVWVVTLSPLLGQGRLFHRLERERQDHWLGRLASSRSFALRQVVNTLKMMACMAYFEEPLAREAQR